MTMEQIWVHKVTHENVHEKLDGIEVEGCTSHLSDQTHLARPAYVGYVPVQSPLISALSDVVVSKPCQVCLDAHGNLRSSEAVMDPDRSLSTEANHDQSLRGEQTILVRGHIVAQSHQVNKSHVLGVGTLGGPSVLGSETSSSLIGRGTAILLLTAVLTAVLLSVVGQQVLKQREEG